MNITKDQVKALLAAEEKATPGPWELHWHPAKMANKLIKNATGSICVETFGSKLIESENDADLIVESRNSIRALCESWLEQQEKLALSEVKKFEHRDALINRAEAAEFKLTQATTANENNIEKLNQTQDALELACEALEFYANSAHWTTEEDEYHFIKITDQDWEKREYGGFCGGGKARVYLANTQAARRKK